MLNLVHLAFLKVNVFQNKKWGGKTFLYEKFSFRLTRDMSWEVPSTAHCSRMLIRQISVVSVVSHLVGISQYSQS